MSTALLLGLPVVLLAAGLPIYLVLITTALVVILTSSDIPLDVVHTTLFGSLDSFPLLAIPFFIFAGEVMARGGIATRLVNWVIALIGKIPGSLALTTIASSELFGAMSGSAVGCVAAVGRLLFPSLVRSGYGERFGASLIASSGAIAVIIPPSIPLIIYGATAQQPITTLFLAGILPALLVGIVDGVYVMIWAHRNLKKREYDVEAPKLGRATKDALWALGTPVVIFGGIYGGVFTPTEAAGIAAAYSVFVSVFVYRELSWADIWKIAEDSVELISQILLIVATAGVYSWLLTTSGLPQTIVDAMSAAQLGPVQTLLVFNVLLLIIGSFLEPPAAILILAPLFLPVVTQLGISPIHFGIIIAVNLSIGMYTPPFGMNLFAAHSLFKVEVAELYKGAFPFLVINALALLVITLVPALSLWIVTK